MALMYYLSFQPLRDYVRTPIEALITRQILGYKKRTEQGINSVKDLLFRVSIVALVVTAIIWISIFMYVVFYYTYMPNVTHIRPVHLQFKACEEQMGMCSYPSAHVQLTKGSQMLMSAQPYRIRLQLDMPESQINKDVGMFMVCAQLRAKGGVLVSSSCRSAMLRHRSWLHNMMRTVFFAPLLMAGVNEERQQLYVELFSDFVDDRSVPVTDAYVELQSRFLQVYSCELLVDAHFTGARHYMYHWPKIAAAIGISTNFFFVSLVCLLSWYHMQEGIPEFVKCKLATENKELDDKKLIGKIKLEREDSSMFLNESLIEEFDEKHLVEQKNK